MPASSGNGRYDSLPFPETEDPVYYGKHYIIDTEDGTRGSVVFYEDGSFEDTTVWYKKIVPDYVIEVLSPEEFVITKGEDSEYFYYYDENHHLVL